jgi:hypothetical protein
MVERVRDVMYSYVINIHGITKVSDALKGQKDKTWGFNPGKIDQKEYVP